MRQKSARPVEPGTYQITGQSVDQLAWRRPNLVLRRDRQLVDARHARSARRETLRLWRDELPRRLPGRRWLTRGRVNEQRRLRRDRPDLHVLDAGWTMRGCRNRGRRRLL